MRLRFAWVLVTLVGCSFGSSEVQTIENSCADDAGCPAGSCVGNICIDDSGASVEVAIEVLRSATDMQRVTPASWAFATEPASGSTDRDLVLPATREVRGVVRWGNLRIPSTLRFVRRMAEPVALLAPVAVEADTLREAVDEDGPGAYDFTTVLIAGETYDVVVLPSSDIVVTPTEATEPAIRSLPPMYSEVVVGAGDVAEPFRFDVEFPVDIIQTCTDNIDAGCTLEAEVLSIDGEDELAESNLQVRAIDRQTGRVVSSIGETDELGRFAIRIGEGVSDYLIRVTSGVGRDPFPAVSVDPDVAFANDPIKKRIYIPRLSPVQFTGSVRDLSNSAVPGATVRFLSTGIFGENQLGLDGSFSGSAVTNEEGVYGAELLPGYYSITVTPPADVENSWGILSAEGLVGEEVLASEALIVPSQFELRGWVTTFGDEIASGVTVLARARPRPEPVATHRSQEAVSTDLGGFEMSVDAGLYDLHLKAPSETGFAWLVEPEVVMSSDLERAYRLDPPIPVRGVVRSSDGEIVTDALIRAYVLTRAEGGATRALQVAETVSGEDGSYRLLIAPRLGDE
jgi:hypothetical protein